MPDAPRLRRRGASTRSLRAAMRIVIAVGSRAISAKASACRPSPARIAIAVAVDDVQRRPAAPQRVVVHGRQVVVDQRVGMDQFDRARGGQRGVARARRRSVRRPRRRATASAAASVEQRPQPLAAGEQAVAHRLGRRAAGTAGGLGQEALERRIDAARAWSMNAASGGTALTSRVRDRQPPARPAPASARRVR